jgi:sugar phosphate permease
MAYFSISCLSIAYKNSVSNRFYVNRYQPRALISLALFLTALGGLLMATYPSYGLMKLIFGYWGFTTIFLFWGASVSFPIFRAIKN